MPIVTPSPEDEPTIYTDIPSMLAKAWDEGYEAADHDAAHSIKSDNPYRE